MFFAIQTKRNFYDCQFASLYEAALPYWSQPLLRGQQLFLEQILILNSGHFSFGRIALPGARKRAESHKSCSPLCKWQRNMEVYPYTVMDRQTDRQTNGFKSLVFIHLKHSKTINLHTLRTKCMKLLILSYERPTLFRKLDVFDTCMLEPAIF